MKYTGHVAYTDHGHVGPVDNESGCLGGLGPSIYDNSEPPPEGDDGRTGGGGVSHSWGNPGACDCITDVLSIEQSPVQCECVHTEGVSSMMERRAGGEGWTTTSQWEVGCQTDRLNPLHACNLHCGGGCG